MKRNVFVFLCLLISSVVFWRIVSEKVLFPTGIPHIIHLAIPPSDLYDYIILDKFIFWQKGFTKTYALEPKYYDFYDLGFVCDKEYLSSQYEFSGEIKFEFFAGGKLLSEEIVTSYDTARYVKGDWGLFKEVSLLNFEIPLEGRYKNDIYLKLTVLEPDENLEQFKDSIKLFVGVGSTP